MKRQRLIFLSLGAALIVAATETAAAQQVVVDATVNVPPVEARVVVGDRGGRVYHRAGPRYRTRRRAGLPRHISEALYRLEQQYHQDLRRADRRLQQRLAQAERRYRHQMHRAHWPGERRQIRREFREAERRAYDSYEREVARAERRFLRKRAEILDRNWGRHHR